MEVASGRVKSEKSKGDRRRVRGDRGIEACPKEKGKNDPICRIYRETVLAELGRSLGGGEQVSRGRAERARVWKGRLRKSVTKDLREYDILGGAYHHVLRGVWGGSRKRTDYHANGRCMNRYLGGKTARMGGGRERGRIKEDFDSDSEGKDRGRQRIKAISGTSNHRTHGGNAYDRGLSEDGSVRIGEKKGKSPSILLSKKKDKERRRDSANKRENLDQNTTLFVQGRGFVRKTI